MTASKDRLRYVGFCKCRTSVMLTRFIVACRVFQIPPFDPRVIGFKSSREGCDHPITFRQLASNRLYHLARVGIMNPLCNSDDLVPAFYDPFDNLCYYIPWWNHALEKILDCELLCIFRGATVPDIWEKTNPKFYW